MKYPMRLVPIFKDYIWGGENLKKSFGKIGDKIAESWELSCMPNNLSVVDNGIFAGQTLKDVLAQNKDFCGENANNFQQFPLLIKLIDAKNDLSIQVHPTIDKVDSKTEMWYIVSAEEGSGIYLGFKENVTLEIVNEALKNNTICELLKFFPTQKGDVFFVEAGAAHAILKGNLICEVQQSSDTTYRLYDYDRRDKDGKPRQLHIDEALKVLSLSKATLQQPIQLKNCRQLIKCNYFTTYEYCVKDEVTLTQSDSSFDCITIVDGQGYIKFDNEIYSALKGDTYFIPSGNTAYKVVGDLTFILSNL